MERNTDSPIKDWKLSVIGWTDWRLLMTPHGPKERRQGKPTQEFWRLWARYKAELKKSGCSVWVAGDKQWVVAEWRNPVAAAKEEKIQAPPVSVNLPEEVSKILLEYQKPIVSEMLRGLERHGCVLNASDMGTGKTVMALAGLKGSTQHVLVVCPKSVVPDWHRTNTQFGFGYSMTAINYEMLRRGVSGILDRKETKKGRKKIVEFVWTLPKNTAIIFDEVHVCSGVDSQNAEMLMEARRAGYRMIIQSGTPANAPMKMKAIGYCLGLHSGGQDFFRFLTQNGYTKGSGKCGMQWDFGLRFNSPSIPRRRDSIMQQLSVKLRAESRLVSISKSQIPDFPEIQIISQPIDFGDATEKISGVYRRLELESSSSRNSRELKELADQSMQEIELLKVPALCSEALELTEAGHSVVMFFNYRASLFDAMKRMNTTCAIYGAQNPEERRANIDAFQSNKKHIILCMIQAGGVGINLHDITGERSRVGIVCPTFWAEIGMQADARIHRAGAKSKAVIKKLYADGTVETEANDVSKAKISRILAFSVQPVA